MKPLVIGDKVRMIHHGSQHTDYNQTTKTGRIIRIYTYQNQTLASVSWSLGPALTQEFIEDLEIMKEPDHGQAET
jgi:DNA polymerase II small subunit/DNA polymerase delta subunit B